MRYLVILTNKKMTKLAFNADDYFRDFPEVDIFYFAADGTAFQNESNAYRYADTLTNKIVTTVKRPTTKSNEVKTSNK